MALVCGDDYLLRGGPFPRDSGRLEVVGGGGLDFGGVELGVLEAHGLRGLEITRAEVSIFGFLFAEQVLLEFFDVRREILRHAGGFISDEELAEVELLFLQTMLVDESLALFHDYLGRLLELELTVSRRDLRQNDLPDPHLLPQREHRPDALREGALALELAFLRPDEVEDEFEAQVAAGCVETGAWGIFVLREARVVFLTGQVARFEH